MLSISNPVSNPLRWLGEDREQREGGREGGTGRNERDNFREMLQAGEKLIPERAWLAEE